MKNLTTFILSGYSFLYFKQRVSVNILLVLLGAMLSPHCGSRVKAVVLALAIIKITWGALTSGAWPLCRQNVQSPGLGPGLQG